MQYFRFSLLFSLGLLFACQESQQSPIDSPVNEAPNPEISFYSADSMQLFADLFILDKAQPIILLFHQGRSNARGEYGTIIPILQEEGFNVLALDQRRGGQAYGSYNRVVANIPLNRFGYCDVYADLEAALDYVIQAGFSDKKILWGSSYSAALAIQLGRKRSEEVAGVLAFSPASGQPMDGCEPEVYFADIKVPLLLLRPSQEAEIESVQNQLARAKENNHQTYVANKGVHGSSMLVEERVKDDVADNWAIVKQFLASINR